MRTFKTDRYNLMTMSVCLSLLALCRVGILMVSPGFLGGSSSRSVGVSLWSI